MGRDAIFAATLLATLALFHPRTALDRVGKQGSRPSWPRAYQNCFLGQFIDRLALSRGFRLKLGQQFVGDVDAVLGCHSASPPAYRSCAIAQSGWLGFAGIICPTRGLALRLAAFLWSALLWVSYRILACAGVFSAAKLPVNR